MDMEAGPRMADTPTVFVAICVGAQNGLPRTPDKYLSAFRGGVNGSNIWGGFCFEMHWQSPSIHRMMETPQPTSLLTAKQY